MNHQLDEVAHTIKNQQKTLLTVIGALSFLSVTLLAGIISLSGFTIDTLQDTKAMSIALDEQRAQYRDCIEKDICERDPISPPSRDIQRNTESSGFAEVLYKNEPTGLHRQVSPTGDDDADDSNSPEYYGVLGYIIYK